MPDPDNGPLTSYSDPFYDRLDAIATKVRRHRFLIILGIIAIIAISLLVNRWRSHSPESIGANALIDARGESDVKAREAALAKLAADGESDAFRAIAANEVAQLRLDRNDIDGARSIAKAGLDAARASTDANLQVTLQLSLAAIEYQAGAIEAAESAYQQVDNASRTRFPNHRITAKLGLARCAVARKDLPAALELLEPLQTSTERGADNLLDDARFLYWQIKRQQAGFSPSASAAAQAMPPAASTATGAPAAVVSSTASVPEPAASATR